MLLFGFESSVRRRLAELESDNTSVGLSHCEKSRKGEQLEVAKLLSLTHIVIIPLAGLSHKTHTAREDKVISISSAEGTVSKLEDLQSLVAFQKITCSIKVTSVDDPMEMSGCQKNKT